MVVVVVVFAAKNYFKFAIVFRTSQWYCCTLHIAGEIIKVPKVQDYRLVEQIRAVAA